MPNSRVKKIRILALAEKDCTVEQLNHKSLHQQGTIKREKLFIQEDNNLVFPHARKKEEKKKKSSFNETLKAPYMVAVLQRINYNKLYSLYCCCFLHYHGVLYNEIIFGSILPTKNNACDCEVGKFRTTVINERKKKGK